MQGFPVEVAARLRSSRNASSSSPAASAASRKSTLSTRWAPTAVVGMAIYTELLAV